MPRTLTINGRPTEDDSTEPEVYLMYHAASHVTGERLGDFLGVPHGRDEAPRRPEYLIRWGSRSGAGYRPTETVFNSQSAMNNNTDKLAALRQLDNAGIPVPNYTDNRDDFGEEIDYPILGRNESHARGEDIELILQWRDAYLTENDFFVEYIPTELEYRMHVVNGEVVKVHEKRLRSEADNHPFIRNAETGWVFLDPRDEPPEDQLAIDAVGALSLDFGAVDVVREEETGDCYVLEVNTAPSLDPANLERYGEKLAEDMGLENYPGLDAVEYPDDEEGEEEESGEDNEDESDGRLGSLFG